MQSGQDQGGKVGATAGFVANRTGDDGNLALEAARQVAQARRERAAGWQWPLFVVALLVIPMVFGGWLVIEALADPGFTAEKDYYKKALDWDQHAKQVAHNSELGWQVAVAPMPVGQGAWRVQLKDAKGGALQGAQLSARIGALTGGQTMQALKGKEVTPGWYELPFAAQRPGIHDVELQFHRGNDLYTWQQHVEATR